MKTRPEPLGYSNRPGQSRQPGQAGQFIQPIQSIQPTQPLWKKEEETTGRKTAFLFRETICGWESWGRVYQSIEAFRPLIQEIFRRHSLPYQEPEHLTPGTNAVFRVGKRIVKIYAPAESGLPPTWAEAAGMRLAEAAGIPTAGVVCLGEIHDRYTFPYLVMNAVEGTEAGDWRPGAASSEKALFAAEVRNLLKALRGCVRTEAAAAEAAASGIPHVFYGNACGSSRWKAFPDSLQAEVERTAKEALEEEAVFVHGDLTCENVLLLPEANGSSSMGKRLFVLDFGDCQLAPFYYEWPPLVWELFRWEPVMLKTCFSEYEKEEFLRILTKAVLLHDFGGNMLQETCRWADIPPSSIGNRRQAEELLRLRLSSEAAFQR